MENIFNNKLFKKIKDNFVSIKGFMSTSFEKNIALYLAINLMI